MPNSNKSSRQNEQPDNHAPQGSLEDVYQDAQGGDEAQAHADDQQSLLDDFKALFKRKDANVKRRITITINALTPLEDVDIPVHMDDVESVRKHLKQADSALDTVNIAIDEHVDLLDHEELAPFVKLASLHVPQIMDIRARINHVQARIIQQNVVAQGGALSPATNNSVNVTKIDNTFKPDPLESNATPAIFQQWRDQFLVYAERNRFEKAPFRQQRILLNMCLSPSVCSTLTRLCSPTSATSIQDLLKELDKYFKKSNNLLMRRYKYFNCIQKPGESIGDYIVRFRDIGDFSSFDEFTYEENMTCRLITGILDETLRSELMRLSSVDFQAAQDFALSWEISKSDASQVLPSSSNSQQAEVAKVSAYKHNRRSSSHKNIANNSNNCANHPSQRQSVNDPMSSRQTTNAFKSCNRCGYSHASGASCPANGQPCAYCKEIGHFKRVCRSRPNRRRQGGPALSRVNQVQDTEFAEHYDCDDHENDPNLDQGDINRVDCAVFMVDHNPESTPTFQAEFRFSDDRSKFSKVLPDTGAAVSVIPAPLLQSWGWHNHIEKTTNLLKSVSGDPLPCHGTIMLNVTISDISCPVSFYVCPDVKNILLSWKVLREFGIISRQFPLPAHISQVLHSEINSYKQSLIRAFPKVFNKSDILSPMRGDAMKIHLKPTVDLSNVNNVYKNIPIPMPLRQAAKTEIDDMLNKKIILPVTKPTPFTSPMLVIPKKGHGVRLVIDYTELNKCIQRPIHPFPSVPEVKAMIPDSSKYFATMDALTGYWQVPLHPSSQHLTTFLTPWGRFCFARAPMGLASSGDEYCRRGDLAFQGIPNVIKVVDDLLIHAPTLSELKSRIHDVLAAADANGISLSAEKFNIGQAVSFVGLSVTHAGIGPDPKHIQAIADFPTPKNKTDLRSFFGLANQFSTFSKDITELSKPLRPLLATQSSWRWSSEHAQAFVNIKKVLARAPILQYFSPSKETKLMTDASRLNGLGYILMQKQDNNWAMISCGSRTITPTEANYAVCELEALAIVWAIQKSRIYLMGLPTFTVVTDHKPLVTIFNSARLSRNDNPRLVRLMQKVASYTFMVEWLPGKMHRIPDALSRAPLPISVVQQQPNFIKEPTVQITDPNIASLSDKARQCPMYSDLYYAVNSMSTHDVSKLPADTHAHVRAFLSVWDRLSCDQQSGLVLLDSHRIVVPRSQVKRLLNLAHSSHQGITRTKARLQSIYFWHGMSNDVIQTVQSCPLCLKFKPCQPSQPLSDPSPPDHPFQQVSCDLFEYQGSHTMVCVDRFSGWPLVAHYSKSPTSAQVIKTLYGFFKDFGIPVSFRHDGARIFVSEEFVTFLKQNNIKDELSAAYYPESNGHAEAAVKAIKSLVKKNWLMRQLDLIQFNLSLLEWRNTPRLPGARSPAELLFGRSLRTLLPAFNHEAISKTDILGAVKRNYDALKNAYQKINCRRRSLKPLVQNDEVLIRDTNSNIWGRRGRIKTVRDRGKSYIVEAQGHLYLRNRKHLKKISC